MKELLKVLLFTILAVSCNFADDPAESELFSGHRPATDEFSFSTPLSSSYKAADTIQITLSHPAILTVAGGTPRLALTIDATTVYANYVSGSGTRDLLFEYTVLAGQNDSDGISVASMLDLNGATVTYTTVSGTNNANTSLVIPNLSTVTVDNTTPSITVVAPPSDNTYYLGENVDYIVTYDESVVVTGTPRLSFNIGGSTKYFDYVGGSGSQLLVFRRTVIASDIDADGIQGQSPIDLNSGTITDPAGNVASLSFSTASVTTPVSTVNLDGTSPPTAASISNVSVTNNNYLTGTDLDIDVQFTKVVNVTNTPRIQITLDSGTVYANYQSGTGTNTLTFRHTVGASDLDNNGIVLVSPIDLNTSGTIIDTNSLNATLSFTPPVTSSVFVNKAGPTVTIDTLAIINIANETSYTITGTCSENTVAVSVDIGGLTSTPTCTAGTYSASLDVSSLADSPTVTITADHSTATQATSSVLKDTVAPTLTLNALTSIALSNHTSYSFSGTCSENGQNVSYTIGALSGSVACTAGTYNFSSIDVSSEADSATFSISTNHSDVAGNPATTATQTTDKDTALPLISITSAPDITNSNKTSYVVIGTCSENGQNVSVDIGGVIVTPTCSSSTWVTSATDVSLVPDGSVTITATHAKVNGNSANDSTSVTKSSTPTVTINTASNIDSSNETAYSISGTCSENGTNVVIDIEGISKTVGCSSGAWSSGITDVSTLTDGTINITADHSTATQATTSVTKDSAAEVVTITSAPAISGANETSYTVSGTCTTNASAVTVNIGILSFTPTCTSSAWSTGIIDVSSLVDGTINITADHTTATQATTSVTKDTTTPTVDSLSVASTQPTSATITWNLNDPGGFTIDDYIINYRVKGSPTWLPFSDGVSTATTATVTGLTASTTYEFRVNVQYDTTNNSAWSNTAEGETQPDSPLFGPNVAMNVGGATSSVVTAYQDSTNITLNGSALVTLNKGQTHTFTSAAFDVIDADKPIYTAGRKSSANVVWSPTSWAGKTFSFNSIRSNPQNLFIYAIEGATVEVKQGATVLDSATLAANGTTTLSWSVYGSYQVVSTGSILAFHISNTTTDPKPLLPSALEIIGFPSSSMRITTDLDSTNYTLRHSNSTLVSGSLNKADVITVNPQGTSSLYQSESLLLSADKKISGASFADSNGSCAAPFLPTNLMKTKYIVNVSSDYVAFASKQAGTIDVIDATDTVIQTLTLTRSGADPNAPYRARRGTTAAGIRFTATVPVAGWYQPNTNTGAADQDETILYGTDD